MNYRDWLQQLIYKIINPVVHGMIKNGLLLCLVVSEILSVRFIKMESW